MRTLQRPIALLIALALVSGPAALLANEAGPPQQLETGDPGGGGGPRPCGFGYSIACGSETIETCIERTLQPTIGPTGVGFTWYCLTKKITVRTLYKDD